MTGAECRSSRDVPVQFHDREPRRLRSIRLSARTISHLMVAFIPKIGLMVAFIPIFALMATIRFINLRGAFGDGGGCR